MKKNLDLKIYGVITIGPKGQIMIPKEARNDLSFQTEQEYIVLLFDEKGFGIGKSNKILKKLKTVFNKVEIISNIILNTKHQFVIPFYVREKLNLSPGDNLIAVGKGNGGLGFIKNNEIEYLLEYIKLNIN